MSWHGVREDEVEVVAVRRPWKVDGDVGVVVKGRTDSDRGSERRM